MKTLVLFLPLLFCFAFVPLSTYVYLEVQGEYCLATVVQTTGSISEYSKETDGVNTWKREARAEIEAIVRKLDAELHYDLKNKGVFIQMYDTRIPRVKPSAAIAAEERVRQDCGGYGYHFQFDVREVNKTRFKYLQKLEISVCLGKDPDKNARRKIRDGILRIIAAIQ